MLLALTRPKWKMELMERRFVLYVVDRRGLSSELRCEPGSLDLEVVEGVLEWEGSLDGDIVVVDR